MLRKLRTKIQIDKNKSKKSNNEMKPNLDDIEGYISNDDFDEKDQEVYDAKKGIYLINVYKIEYLFIYYIIQIIL